MHKYGGVKNLFHPLAFVLFVETMTPTTTSTTIEKIAGRTLRSLSFVVALLCILMVFLVSASSSTVMHSSTFCVENNDYYVCTILRSSALCQLQVPVLGTSMKLRFRCQLTSRFVQVVVLSRIPSIGTIILRSPSRRNDIIHDCRMNTRK
jgi:hypothetical protein